MTDQYALEKYTRFTEREVRELCVQYHTNYTEISNWYDGYAFRRHKHIFNPRSGVAALKNHALSNYWTSTETYEALKIYIDMDFDGLKPDIVQMLGGGQIKMNTFSFCNDINGEFENAMSVGGWPEIMRILKASEKSWS